MTWHWSLAMNGDLRLHGFRVKQTITTATVECLWGGIIDRFEYCPPLSAT